MGSNSTTRGNDKQEPEEVPASGSHGEKGGNGNHKQWELRTSYLARAVTPGIYVLPPLRAECMYDIAINGIAGAGTVTVLPAK